jgi:putative addiction module killer protein
VGYEVVTTEIFDGWLDDLADPIAARAIAKRLVRVGAGLFGDVEPVGDGVSELKFHIGPGIGSISRSGGASS